MWLNIKVTDPKTVLVIIGYIMNIPEEAESHGRL